MGRIRKFKYICIISIAALLLLCLIYNIVILTVSKDFSVYSGAPVKNISTLSTRTSFVTSNGDVYITGKYYHDLDTAVGLTDIKERAYQMAQGPVKIFQDYADDVILTSFGGFITQNSKLYIFTIEQAEFKTPELIADDCLVPVNAFNFEQKSYCCLYINNDNELILKSINENWSQKCLENVLECKYYSNGVYIVLKTDGSLWLTEDFPKISDFNEESSYINIANNIKSFAYSSLAFGGQGEQDNFVLLSKDNKVYKKYGLNAPLEEICSDAKDVGIHQQNIIILTPENKLVYFTNNGVKNQMKAENVETISVSDDIICAYSKTEGLLFWGTNKYNAFGCDTTSIKVDLNSVPATMEDTD